MELYSTTLLAEAGSATPALRADKTAVPSPHKGHLSSDSRSLDKVTLSKEAKEKSAAENKPSDQDPKQMSAQNKQDLSSQELSQLRYLKQRDAEVRSHELAHLSTAGRHAKGGASFVYQKGPDGVSYAIGGEVGIDVSQAATPEATIEKMQTIKRAALAPLNPSPTDRRVAAQATTKETMARQEIIKQQHEELMAGRLDEKKASTSGEEEISANNPYNAQGQQTNMFEAIG